MTAADAQAEHFEIRFLTARGELVTCQIPEPTIDSWRRISPAAGMPALKQFACTLVGYHRGRRESSPGETWRVEVGIRRIECLRVDAASELHRRVGAARPRA